MYCLELQTLQSASANALQSHHTHPASSPASPCPLRTRVYVTHCAILTLSPAPPTHRPPVLGLKAIPSNNLGTLAWSLHADTSATGPQQQQLQQQQPLQQQQHLQQAGDGVSASSQASGLYMFYQDPNGLMVGTTRRAPAGAASFSKMQDCMSACDDDTA